MGYQSNALWPEGVYSSIYGDSISTDTHDTYEQAAAVCRALERQGFGGDGVNFPVRTWVNESQGDRNGRSKAKAKRH